MQKEQTNLDLSFSVYCAKLASNNQKTLPERVTEKMSKATPRGLGAVMHVHMRGAAPAPQPASALMERERDAGSVCECASVLH